MSLRYSGSLGSLLPAVLDAVFFSPLSLFFPSSWFTTSHSWSVIKPKMPLPDSRLLFLSRPLLPRLGITSEFGPQAAALSGAPLLLQLLDRDIAGGRRASYPLCLHEDLVAARALWQLGLEHLAHATYGSLGEGGPRVVVGYLIDTP